MGQHLRESHRAAPPVVNNIVTDDSREANGHNHMNKIQESIESPDLSKAQVTRHLEVQQAPGNMTPTLECAAGLHRVQL